MDYEQKILELESRFDCVCNRMESINNSSDRTVVEVDDFVSSEEKMRQMIESNKSVEPVDEDGFEIVLQSLESAVERLEAVVEKYEKSHGAGD